MKKLFLLLALAALGLSAQAKVRLPNVLSEGMILQQDSDVRLWGWAKAGKKISVTTSWDDQVYTTKTGDDGRWLLTVHTPAASFTPLSLTISDGDDVTINDILAGEVWVCAGQSNMEMPVKGFGNCPVEGYNEAVIEAASGQYSGIHFVKIPSVMSMTPLEDADCEWKSVSAATVGDCSATGYFFAQVVNRALQVPVGLIMANKGGTRVESWLDEEYLRENTTEVLDSMAMVEKWSWDYHRPLVWGNGTFAPIQNYTVKGILFYQGCSNVGDPAGQYTQRLADLVKQWRRDFREGDIPFYFVQIAPYYNDDKDGDWGPKLREQQFNAAKVIPNSAVVCTDDLVYDYESQQIHPCQKQPVGQRLAFQALNKTYGMKELWCDSPELKDYTFSNDTCFVHLQNDYDGISRYEDLQGFELAGEDRVFHKADAYYYWTQGIIVTCPEVPKPVAVRYAFRNWGFGNVKNAALLPLFPFRSDDW